MRFDVVVANPPFSLDKWGGKEAEADHYNRFWRGVPPKSKGDYAFITHMIETALPPAGARGRGRSARRPVPWRREGRIRQSADRGEPARRRHRPARQPVPDHGHSGRDPGLRPRAEKGGAREDCRDVLFIDASRDYQPGKNQNSLLPEHIAKVLDTYRARRPVEKYAHVASFEEIAENDFNLNIPRYVDTFEEEEEIDVAAVEREIERLESELAEVRIRMKQYLKELGL